jgi:large subunit ribosomal protein L7/L12
MVKELSVLELSEWVKTLEKEFGVSAQAVVVGGASGGAQGPAAPAEEEKKDSYTVMLTAVGDKKIQVIKEVRTVTSLGLREAKALVDEAPKPVREGVSEQEANEIKAKLEAAGASVELK